MLSLAEYLLLLLLLHGRAIMLVCLQYHLFCISAVEMNASIARRMIVR